MDSATLLGSIASRTSTRDYADERVSSATLAAVREAGERAEPLTTARLRFHLVEDGDVIQGEVKGLLGDYGKVIRAPHYVVVSAVESDHYLVDAGYRFEQMILAATARGVATCWVGGFFREASLRGALGLEVDERIVALSPLGVRAEQTSLLNRVIKAAIRASDRKPIDALFSWGHPGERLPDRLREDERWAQLLEAARRAPSWANSQPWRFVVTPSEILLYKTARQLKEGKDYHLVDCGIVMAHVALAARALGLGGAWSLAPASVPGLPDAEVIGRFPLDSRPGAHDNPPAPGR